MKSILHIVTRWGGGIGGVKAFIHGVANSSTTQEVRQEVLSVGSITGGSFKGIVPLGPIVNSDSPARILCAGRSLTRWLGEHKFDVVHIHTNNGLGFLFADAAKRAGVGTRIVHAHNSALGDSSIAKRLVNEITISAYRGSETHRLACSDVAGQFLFSGKPFDLISNGVDASRFTFDFGKRSEARIRLGFTDCDIVIGNIGSFIPAKNTGKLLDVFATLSQFEPRAKLLLIGDGPEKDRFRNALTGPLSQSIVSTGFVENVAPLYSAMDVLVLPSLYEGFPICMVEAQVNSLPVVASDSVAAETALTDLVRFISLDEGNDTWAHTINEQADRRFVCINSASSYPKIVADAGFTLDATCARLIDIYLNGDVRG